MLCSTKFLDMKTLAETEKHLFYTILLESCVEFYCIFNVYKL